MKKGLLTLFALLLPLTHLMAQKKGGVNWSYESHPELPYKVDHVDLEIYVDPSVPLLKATGTYDILSRRPDLYEIVLNTADLDVQTVLSNGEPLTFRVSSDSLIVQLKDSLGVGERSSLEIKWESSSPYAIHRDVYGNVWTSLNPHSHHHWIPMIDHPEISFSLDASLTVPADQEVIFNGSQTGSEVISPEEKTVTFQSEARIPINGLNLAVGSFEKESARAGVKQVNLYASGDLLLEPVRTGLLDIAVSALKDMEEQLDLEFPYDDLQVVVLPDNKWEEMQTGAGIIYIYTRLGSLSTQLRRGLAEQWLGNFHRYLDAPDNKYEFLKTLLTGTEETEQLLNPDELQSVHKWNIWERGLSNLNEPFMLQSIRDALPGMMKKMEGVSSWEEYADHWYDLTGTYWGDLPNPVITESGNKDIHPYQVDYSLDEANSQLTLTFEALNDPVRTLFGVKATQYSFSDTSSKEFSVTGALDSVTLSVSPGIDYLTLQPVSDAEIQLKENKPFIFLIRQLRAQQPKWRLQAALQLREYADNPDLQLAIRDVLQSEENMQVRGALLETQASIMNGATGTEQTFLDMLNSESQEVEIAAIQSLIHYPGNESVSYAIQNKLMNTRSDSVFQAALHTYSRLVSIGELLDLADRLKKRGGRDLQVVKILSATADQDSTQRSVEMADDYLTGYYPYPVRMTALELMLEHQKAASYWSTELQALLRDRDPRIRYHALDAVTLLSPKERVEFTSERIREEMDPRIHRKLQRMIGAQ